MSGNLAIKASGVTRSHNLVLSLDRAGNYAEEQSHREVGLEHLLLAFTEDPDTLQSLRACGVEVESMRERLAEYLAQAEFSGDEAERGLAPRPSAALVRLMQDATDATLDAHRTEVNSFIVLAALVGSEASDAARILDEHGFTWDKAIKALQPAVAPASSPPPKEGGLSPAAERGDRAPALISRRPPDATPDEAWQLELATGEPASDTQDEDQVQDEGGTPSTLAVLPLTEAQPGFDLDAEPRFAAPDRKAARSPRPQVGEQPAATVDDIMASVRRKLGTKPAPARVEPALDLPVAPRWQPLAEAEARPQVPVAQKTPETAPVKPTAAARPAALPVGGPKAKRTSLEELVARAAAEAMISPQPPPEVAPWPDVRERRPSLDDSFVRPRSSMITQPAPPEPAPIEEPPPIPMPALPYVTEPDRRRASPQLDTKSLMADWPLHWRLGRAREIRIEVPRGAIEGLARDISSGNAAAEFSVGAVTLRLRSDRRFFAVEPQSPETQWIENTQGLLTDGAITWRWVATPRRTGRSALRLVASVRTLGADGAAVEYALPDAAAHVRTKGRIGEKLKWLGWIIAGLLIAAETYQALSGHNVISNALAALIAPLITR